MTICRLEKSISAILRDGKHKAAMEDSNLSEEEWNDPLFRAAVRKYMEIKDSSRILSLIKTALRTLEKWEYLSIISI